MAREIQRVGVVGLGTMGAGIAEVFARQGFDVVAVESLDEAIERGRGHIDTSLARALERGKLSADERDATLAAVAELL